MKGIYFANPRIQWVARAPVQTVTTQRAKLDRISTSAKRTWPERISASVCRLILILFQVELTIHGHAVMLLTRSMSGETPDPHCHMSIWQRLGFVGKEHTGGVSLNGNAEVLLGTLGSAMPTGGVAVPLCDRGLGMPERSTADIKIPSLLALWNVARASRLRAEVVRCQVRRLTHLSAFENPQSWRCWYGTPQAISKSSGPLTVENPVHVENSGFAAALFYQTGNRNLKALHRLAQLPSFSKICECVGLT